MAEKSPLRSGSFAEDNEMWLRLAREYEFDYSPHAMTNIVAYPDSGKVGLWTREDGYVGLVRDEPKLDYWDGE